MKHFSVWMLLLALFVSANKLEAQQATAYFHFEKLPEVETGYFEFLEGMKWYVNQIPLLPGDSAKKIIVHWPNFDTILVKEKFSSDRVILTRFQPDSNYFLITGTVGDDFEINKNIVLTSSQQQYLDSLEMVKEKLDFPLYCYLHASLYTNQVERGEVKFRVINAEASDTIAGTFGREHGSVTSGVVLKGDSFIDAGRPFYLPLAYSFNFKIRTGFVSDSTSHPPLIESKTKHFYTKENKVYALTKEYFRIEYRFLRPETLYITLDAKTGKVTMIVKSP